MAGRTKRRRVPKHLVCPDTNILWSDDKAPVVSSEFSEFWREHSDLFELELVLSDVVRGELLYQQVDAATRSLTRARESLERAASIAESSYRLRLSNEQLRTDIENKFDAWRTQINARIIPTPVDEIDWRTVIHASLWRLPPFSEDPKNQKIEKGFRDAMILETALSICRGAGAEQHVAFLSNDRLLREAFDDRVDDSDYVRSFESTEDLSAYLRLADEELTIEFVNSIQRRASQKFFDPRENDGLYFSAGVLELAREQFAESFALNRDQDNRPILAMLNRPMSWAEQGSLRTWISDARFDRLEDDRNFHWKNSVTFVQLFSASQGSILGTFGVSQSESSADVGWRVRVIQVDVSWAARVQSDGRFYDLVVTGLDEVSCTFGPPTQDQINRYQLQVAA